ncbi:MAG: hypothetical protein JNN11_03135 [Candidatus Doudnabacteria bacterium]|nr:hypothetical protein [Candidatus Doudnabacteria bacterium]
MKKKTKKKNFVVVNDRMQKGYRYELLESAGKNFDPRFKPELTPAKMLELGVFGGVYLRDCQKEFPKSWFLKAKFQKPGTFKREPKINFFKVNASQSLKEWKRKGWIYKEDPRGWFQWYCRYYMGRRCKDDERQIKRWLAIRRHIAQIKKNCFPGQFSCHSKQRQAVLHWAYDSRKI